MGQSGSPGQGKETAPKVNIPSMELMRFILPRGPCMNPRGTHKGTSVLEGAASGPLSPQPRPEQFPDVLSDSISTLALEGQDQGSRVFR